MYAAMINNIIQEAFKDEPDKECILKKKVNKTNIAYYFFNSSMVSLWVYENKNSCYIQISKKALTGFPGILPLNYIEEKDIYRIFDTDYNYLLKLILFIKDYFDQAADIEFDCCSRYLECSRNMKCIQPKVEYAVLCSYRKKLKKGIVFFK